MAYNNREYQVVNLNGSPAAVQVFSGRGILHSIALNTQANGTIKVIDNTTGSTANVATITMGATPTVDKFYDCVIAAGLRIVMSSSPDITVTYTNI